MPIRIVIAAQHGLVRDGLRALLECVPSFRVIAESHDEEKALGVVREWSPDVVLIDTSRPTFASVDLVPKLLQQRPRARVLILTIHEDGSRVRDTLLAGAAGCIAKDAAGSELVRAIQIIHAGNIYVHPALTRALLEGPPSSSASGSRPNPLTAREDQVLCLIAQGYTNRQIAEVLSLSVRTVESHRANLTGKLGVSDRAQLVRYATEHELLRSIARPLSTPDKVPSAAISPT